MATTSDQVPEITPEEARDLAASGAYLLDVREDDEWKAGHATGAAHIAMGLVMDRIGEVPSGRTVICICRAGGRSGAVATTLAGLDLDARNLTGGMLAWEAAGFPVITDDGGPGRII